MSSKFKGPALQQNASLKPNARNPERTMFGFPGLYPVPEENKTTPEVPETAATPDAPQGSPTLPAISSDKKISNEPVQKMPGKEPGDELKKSPETENTLEKRPVSEKSAGTGKREKQHRNPGKGPGGTRENAPSSGKMIQRSYRIPDVTRKALCKMANHTGRTKSELLTEALQNYLNAALQSSDFKAIEIPKVPSPATVYNTSGYQIPQNLAIALNLLSEASGNAKSAIISTALEKYLPNSYFRNPELDKKELAALLESPTKKQLP